MWTMQIEKTFSTLYTTVLVSLPPAAPWPGDQSIPAPSRKPQGSAKVFERNVEIAMHFFET